MSQKRAVLAFWKNYDRKLYLKAAQLADELGYDSFWVPDRIQDATETLDWTIPNAHNVVLEIVLNTGIIGGGLFVLMALSTIYAASRRLWLTRETTLCFPVAIGLFTITNCFFESGYSQPTGTDSFLASLALVMAAILPSSELVRREATRHSESQRERTEPRPKLRQNDSTKVTVSHRQPQTGWGRPSRTEH